MTKGILLLLATLILPVIALEAPPNDLFSNAAPLVGTAPQGSGTLDLATREPAEPQTELGKESAGRSLWWNWTALSKGVVRISITSSNFISTIGVFQGDELAALDRISTSNPNAPPPSEFLQIPNPIVVQLPPYADFREVIFTALAGESYFIAIDEHHLLDLAYDFERQFAFQLSFISAPENDSFQNATPIIPQATSFSGTAYGAVRESGEPISPFAPGHTVWYQWTPPANGMCFLTATSDAVPLVTVFHGITLSGILPVKTNASLWTSPCGDEWRAKRNFGFGARAGKTYHFQVDSVDEFSFNMEFLPAPSNDDFANRTAFYRNAGALWLTNSTHGATAEPGEPSHGVNGGASRWYKWTASRNGSLTIAETGPLIYPTPTVTNFPSIFDPTTTGVITDHVIPCPFTEVDPDIFYPSFAIYEGDQLNTLTQLAAGRTAIADVQAGKEYSIAVDSNHGLPGIYRLSLAFNPPATNDHFHHSIPVGGGHLRVESHIVGATAEPAEPLHWNAPAKRSIWWSWTAPATAPVHIHTVANDYDLPFPTRLAVYTGTSLETLEEKVSGTNYIVFLARRGVTYQLAADTETGEVGAVALEIEMVAPTETLPRSLETTAGLFTFLVRAPAGDQVSVQHSYDLENWIEIGKHPMTADAEYLTVPYSHGETHAFFRVITLD